MYNYNTMRAFIGINLPLALKKKIFAYAQEISKDWRIKLVEEKNLHLTLLFLGNISEKDKEKITKVLNGFIGFGTINLKISGVEFFPDTKTARGIWLNVAGEKEKLFSLYKRMIDGFLSAGINLEERNLRFSPHITLGRLKEKRRKIGNIDEPSGEFKTEKITFFESRLSRDGPRYIKIDEFEVK